MWITEVFFPGPDPAYGASGGVIIAAAAGELRLELMQQLIRHLIVAHLIEVLHKSRNIGIVPGEEAQKPL